MAMSARLPAPIEAARQAALERYAILDTVAERGFDRFTEIAAQVFRVPIALITLIDNERQWFKSCVGLPPGETTRESSFCTHALGSDAPLLVPDAHHDPRFAENPFVTGPPYVRFYAGAPLVVPGGHRLGTLCVIDHVPRALDADQLALLRSLAAGVVDQLKLRRLGREVDEARARLDTILESMQEVVVVATTGGETTVFNRAARELFGTASRSSDPRDWVTETRILVPDADAPFPPDRLPIVRALAGETVRGELLRLEIAGESRWHLVNADPLRDPDGRVAAALTVGRDVTEERRLADAIRAEARTDPLTGISNRRALVDITPHLFARADRHGAAPIAAVAFDLDRFKAINDGHGHDVGDAVLRAFADVLRDTVREGDLAARWGGEEFVAVFPDCDLEGARAVAERVRQRTAALDVPRAGRVTVSAGVAQRAPGETLDGLIGRADQAMYAAKRAGRDCVR